MIVLEALRPVGNDDALIFVTRIEEEDLTQEALIEARPSHKTEGVVFVGIKPFAQPLVTKGTREAVRLIVEWLEQHGLHLVGRFF